MKAEEFQRLQEQCKPTADSYNPQTEPAGYYPLSFARAMLPKMNPFNLKYLKVYDGAELFKGAATDDTKILKIKAEETPYSVSLFTYPKGVLAEKLKSKLQVGQSEISVLAEVSQDDKIEVYFRVGKTLEKLFLDYSKNSKSTNNSKPISGRAFNTDISAFKKYFNKTISHSNLITFMGKTIGVNFDEVVLKVEITSIKVQTSEPADNGSRQVKEKQQKYIIIDFEILNQLATNYSIHIYKGKEKIYEQVYLPEVIINASKDKQNLQILKSNKSNEPLVHQPGKYQIVWDCTNNNVFDEKDPRQKLTIKIQAIGISKQIAIAQKEILLKKTVENAEIDNFIILYDKAKNEIIIFGSEIIERQRKLKNKIPQEQYLQLTKEEQLIIDLPIILTKLNWLYSAYCQLHWLEGSGDEIYLPINFIMGYDRVLKTFEIMKYDFTQIKYASYIDETKYNPNVNLDDSSNKFLYNFKWGEVIKAYQKALDFIQSIDDYAEHDFGNFDMDEEPPKMNFVKSYPVGSEVFGFATGDFDDLGGCGGRIALRIYAKGIIEKQEINSEELNVYYLNISKVGYRFYDTFSFGEKKRDGSIEEQALGAWKFDIDNPVTPDRFTWGRSNWFAIENATYRKILDKNNLGITPQKFDIITHIEELEVPNEMKVTENIPFYI